MKSVQYITYGNLNYDRFNHVNSSGNTATSTASTGGLFGGTATNTFGNNTNTGNTTVHLFICYVYCLLLIAIDKPSPMIISS